MKLIFYKKTGSLMYICEIVISDPKGTTFIVLAFIKLSTYFKYKA